MAGSFLSGDLAGVFNTDEFGSSATYGGSTISVIFDAPVEAFVDGQIEMTAPQALAETADVADAARGETLVVGGTTYYITSVEHDGTGVTRLTLSEQAP